MGRGKEDEDHAEKKREKKSMIFNERRPPGKSNKKAPRNQKPSPSGTRLGGGKKMPVIA